MNIERLKTLANVTLANAKSFDMTTYIDGTDGFDKKPKPYFDKVEGKAVFLSECGTTCCFAGLAALLFAPDDVIIGIDCNIHEVAQRELDLTDDEAYDLCFTELGEDKNIGFEQEKLQYNSPETYAQAGYNRIYEFIKQYEEVDSQ